MTSEAISQQRAVARPAASIARRPSAPWLAVGLLTAVAFLLRVRTMRDGIFGDEVFSLDETRGHGFFGVIDAVAHGEPGHARLEDNPPLFFMLAWLAERLGDPTAWIRLPSSLAGAGTVPVVYLLGRRAFGQLQGIAAAAFFALTPFAIFYGGEARAYSLLMFLAALSTLALLVALERRGAGWWALYGLAVVALLYTHYTGAVIVAVHGAWTLWFHRQQWRPLLLVYGAVVLLYIPWFPYVDGQPANFGFLAQFLHIDYSDSLLQWLLGLPEFQPGDFPGALPPILLGAGVVVGLAGWALAGAAGWRRLERPAAPQLLMFVFAVATPIACLVYGLRGPDLFLFARNLLASLPFVAVALGAILIPPRRAIAVAAICLAGLAVGIASVKSLDRQYRRPDFRAVASVLDQRAGPRDLSVYFGRGLAAVILLDGVKLYTHERHPFAGAELTAGSLSHSLATHGNAAPRAFIIGPVDEEQLPPPVAGWEQTEVRAFAGHPALWVRTYDRLRSNQYELDAGELRAASGETTPIVERRDAGVLDGVIAGAGAVTLSGWAATADHRPVDTVLAFVAGRLVAAGIPTADRPDLAKAWNVAPGDLGFKLETPSELLRPTGTKVSLFALADGKANPIQIACSTPAPQVAGC
jgi:mannosyltransferase